MSRLGPATWRRLAAGGFVTAVLLIDAWVALRHPDSHGDTAGLVIGSQKILDCLHHHVFTSCETWRGGHPDPRGGMAYVGPWPLLQYLPAIALRELGVSRLATLHVLIVANAVALSAMVGLVAITLRRSASVSWIPVMVATLIVGPLLWYGTTAFGEALASAVIVAAIAAVLLRARPALVGALVAVASTTKETNAVFVLVLVVVCVLAHNARRPDDKAASRRLLAGAAIGALAGAGANSAFNVLRFGSIRNTTYLQASQHAPNSAVVGKSFAALWVAPNGGLLWFWPSSLAVLALIGAGAIWTLRRSAWNWSVVAPLLVTAILIIEVAGVSTWYSPFGWHSWGPRLLLALMPALLLIACVFAGDRATHLLHRFLAGRWLWPAAFVTIAMGLANATVLFEPSYAPRFFGDPHCANAHIGTNPAAYYRCFDYLAWRKQPFLLRMGLDGFHTAGGKLIAFVFATAVILLLRAARTDARRSLGPSTSPHGTVLPAPTSA